MKTTSLTLELKTDSAAENNKQWVHLLPSGTFRARDGRGPWSVTDSDAVIEATKKFAGKNQLPIDFEHQLDLSAKNGQPAPAAGWIEALQSRTNGIWGLVSWTKKSAAFLKNKEYKYLSPVISYTPDGEVTRIMRAALTNNPALEMTALAKSEDEINQEENPESTESNEFSKLAEILGLDESATLEDITQAIQNLLTAKNSVEPSPLEYVKLGEFTKVVTELQKTNENTLLAKVDDAINKNLLPASLKSWGVSMCRADSGAFDDFLKRIGVIYGFMQTCQTDRLTVEERALLEGDMTNSSSDNDILSNLGLSQDDFKKYGDK